jgi:hypothetical protein
MMLRIFCSLMFLAFVLASRGLEAQTSAQIYAKACREAVGPLPDFSCADGAIVPVTVDGVSVSNPKPGMTCDQPALLNNGAKSDGQCVPYSRILSLTTRSMQVAVMCRQKKIRSADSMKFDEIDVIAHNPASGATCWFQASGTSDHPVDGAHVASPTVGASDNYWNRPELVVHDGCGKCHDNNPFMYSPFVGQVWNVMPVDPFGPYFQVDPIGLGFSAWPTDTFSLRDNTCLGCHRIGREQTCGNLTLWMSGRDIPIGADAWAHRFPGSHTMPPGFAQTVESWNILYGRSIDQVRSCCEKPDQQACNLQKNLSPPG